MPADGELEENSRSSLDRPIAPRFLPRRPRPNLEGLSTHDTEPCDGNGYDRGAFRAQSRVASARHPFRAFTFIHAVDEGNIPGSGIENTVVSQPQISAGGDGMVEILGLLYISYSVMGSTCLGGKAS